MQEKGIGPVADRDAATDEAIMGLLVEDRGLWSIGEMQRVIGDEIAATDSLARLQRGGLVHRCGDFVFASRTALEAAALWGPYSTGRG
jgi:hypothetical protein